MVRSDSLSSTIRMSATPALAFLGRPRLPPLPDVLQVPVGGFDTLARGLQVALGLAQLLAHAQLLVRVVAAAGPVDVAQAHGIELSPQLADLALGALPLRPRRDDRVEKRTLVREAVFGGLRWRPAFGRG